MDTLTNLSTRRSIRKYLQKPVETEKIEKMLRAAMDAPSALDEQPWHFLALTDPPILKQIPEHHSHSDLVKDAPAAILTCFDKALEKLPGFWVQDCAAASQNLLIAAHELGLGAVWIGVYPTDENVKGLQKLLKLPESIVPFSLTAFGYPDEPYPQKNNFLAERIHWNQW